MWGNVCSGVIVGLDVYLGHHFGFIGFEAVGV
jgi:hypothetical protein